MANVRLRRRPRRGGRDAAPGPCGRPGRLLGGGRHRPAGRPDLPGRAGGRAGPRRGRGRPPGAGPAGAHRQGRELPARPPGPGRHHRPAPGLPGGRRRRAVRPRPAPPGGHRSGGGGGRPAAARAPCAAQYLVGEPRRRRAAWWRWPWERLRRRGAAGRGRHHGSRDAGSYGFWDLAGPGANEAAPPSGPRTRAVGGGFVRQWESSRRHPSGSTRGRWCGWRWRPG